MKSFDIVWTLYNPNLKKRVEAPNTHVLEAETMEQALKILSESDLPRPMGYIQCIGVSVTEKFL